MRGFFFVVPYFVFLVHEGERIYSGVFLYQPCNTCAFCCIPREKYILTVNAALISLNMAGPPGRVSSSRTGPCCNPGCGMHFSHIYQHFAADRAAVVPLLLITASHIGLTIVNIRRIVLHGSAICRGIPLQEIFHDLRSLRR